MTSKPRESNTCRECKRRKLKCDVLRPACSRCRGRKITCIYPDATEVPPSLQHTNIPPHSDAPAFLPSQPYDLAARIPMGEASSGNGLPALGTGPREQSPTNHRRQRRDESPVGQTPDADIGHLSIQNGGRTRYIGAHHWACICDKTDRIDDLLRSQNRYGHAEPETGAWHGLPEGRQPPSLPRDPSSRNSEDANMSAVSNDEREDLLRRHPSHNPDGSKSNRFQAPKSIDFEQFPSRPYADMLVKGFLQGNQALSPLIHVPTFIKDYKKFWTAQTSEESSSRPNAAFIALLYAILFAGSVAVSKTLQEPFCSGKPRQVVSQELYIHTMQALRQANYIRTPAIESFAAFLISQSIRLRDEEPLISCSFVGVAIRIAQMLGLNRDPSHFSSLSPVIGEIRRRLWWYLFYVDVSVSVAAGLPTLIVDATWDVRPISELKDRFIGTEEARGYEEALASGCHHPIPTEHYDVGRDPLVSTSGIYAAGKYWDALALKHILSILSQQRPMVRSDVNQIRTEFEQNRLNIMARANRIPRSAGSMDSDGGSFTETYAENPVLNRWARVVLFAICDKNWPFLYHPMIHSAINNVWGSLGSSVFEHCQDYLKKCIYLAVNDDFQPFQWSWPGQHQPLHALMVMTRALDHDPQMPYANEYRSIVDEAFALCAPTGGLSGVEGRDHLHGPLVDGGREAWELLFRLRAQAWQKSGVDPDVLWTRQQVTERSYARVEQLTRERHQPLHSELLPPTAHVANESDEPDPITSGLFSANNVPEGAPLPDFDWAQWSHLFGDEIGGWGNLFANDA